MLLGNFKLAALQSKAIFHCKSLEWLIPRESPRLGQAKRGRIELAAGGDLELEKDPVEVVANGPVRDEQLLPDFSVGQPVGRKAGDLQFLRRELVPRLRCSAVARLAGGAQFLAGFFGQRGEGQGVESVSCRPQWGTRVGDSPLAA
jgi:hypothetical protein